MKKSFFLFCWLLIFLTAGCQQQAAKVSLEDRIGSLEKQNAALAAELEKEHLQTGELEKQLAALAGLKDAGELAGVARLKSVRIGRYTNLYDKNGDGVKEKLIVYLQPMDENGDIVKAAGSVEVQLWDMEKKGGEALLGTWRVGAEELKKLWLASFMTINYRLSFDVAEQLSRPQQTPLTVKVVFTDHITGKVFRAQKTIEPR